MPKLFLTVLRYYFIIKLYYFRLAICYEMIDSVFELSIKPYWFLSSIQTQQLLIHYIQCNLDIKLVFSSFKIGNLFGVKDPVPDGLRSHVVYKFLCAGSNTFYIAETCRHLESTWLETGSLTFSSIRKILHIVALCVQQITSMF